MLILPVFPIVATSTLALSAVETVRAAEPSLQPVLSLEPVPTAERLLAAQGTRRAWEPDWVVQLGAHVVDGQYDSNQAPGGLDSDTLLSADFVVYNWRQEMGVGLEGGLWMNSYDAKLDSVGNTETVDTLRVLLGLRIADRGPSDAFWIPYVRVGALYRMDDGTQVSESDFGWYAGGGVDFRLGSRLALTPQVLYSESPSLNSQEWLFGLSLTIAF